MQNIIFNLMWLGIVGYIQLSILLLCIILLDIASTFSFN